MAARDRRLTRHSPSLPARHAGSQPTWARRKGAPPLWRRSRPADIVINNLGVFQPGDFFETNDATWDRHWQVNVMSAVRLARAYLPGMARAGWGRFVTLGSESAFNIPVEMIHYGVSKTADVALARGLAKRIAGTGVTVNSVLPGPTLSGGVAAMLKDDASGLPIEEAAAAFVRQHRPSFIIGRAASVEEVANMVVYIASPLASATTRAALRVDGGVIDTLMWHGRLCLAGSGLSASEPGLTISNVR